MRFYPMVASRRTATMAADVLIIALVVLFAWFAASVHDAMNDVAEIAGGVESAGTSAQEALADAADRVDGVPIVGSELAAALRTTSTSTGEEVVALARSSREDIEGAAIVLAVALFLIPTVLLMVGYLPNRYTQIQRLTAARRALIHPPSSPRHRQALAMRAAFGLPFSTLLRYTDDPLGDLARGDYDALIAAAHEEGGLLRR